VRGVRSRITTDVSRLRDPVTTSISRRIFNRLPSRIRGYSQTSKRLSASTVSSVLTEKHVLIRHSVLLLKNFLHALKTSNSIPQRLLLQTGAKHYGVHIGPTLIPMEGSDPRYLRQGDFYFAQEDLLWSWCARHNVGWNVTRPTRANPYSLSSAGLPRYIGENPNLACPRVIWSDLGRFRTSRRRRAVTVMEVRR
jgi:hypothetical protein